MLVSLLRIVGEDSGDGLMKVFMDGVRPVSKYWDNVDREHIDKEVRKRVDGLVT